MRNYYIIFFFLLYLGSSICGGALRAQTDCDKTLIAAENLYQSGQLYAVPEKLIPCLENGFNEQDKQSAYRLLTLTYLYINQEEKAKNTFHKLLKLNPDYVVSRGKDPIELYNLYQQFNVNPVYYIGFGVGGIITQPFVLHQRSSSSLAASSDKFYDPFYGFSLGADFALPLHKRLLLEFSPAYARSNYLFSSFYLTDYFSQSQEVVQVQEVSGRESYQHAILPLTLNFRIPGKKSRLFYNIAAGAGASFLLASSYRNVNRVNRQIFAEDINVNEIQSTPFRRQTNIFGKIELGLEYKYLGFFWGVRTGISSTLFNFTRYPNQQERFLNRMSTTFGWVEDDFVLANGHLSVFVRKPIYKFLKVRKE